MLSYDKEENGKPIALVTPSKPPKIIFINPDSEEGSSKITIVGKSRLTPLPDPTSRQFIYIAGPSGSGKSTYAAQYIFNYRELFPDNNIYVFSRLNDDEIIDMLNVIRVPIDESLVEIDVTKDLMDCLVLFDDIDTIPDKMIKNLVYAIQNDILEIGRHNNISVIVTSHLINGNDRKNCRTILNEAHSITFFPKSGNTYGISYLLKNYIGLNKNSIKDILSLSSRWITILKGYPQTCFYEKGAFIIN